MLYYHRMHASLLNIDKISSKNINNNFVDEDNSDNNNNNYHNHDEVDNKNNSDEITHLY